MKLKLICTITNNSDLLPHFLKHYSKQGVTHFYFFKYASADRLHIPQKYKNVVTVINSCCTEGVREHDFNILNPLHILQQTFIGYDEWFVPADLDEFATISKTLRIVDAIDICNKKALIVFQVDLLIA